MNARALKEYVLTEILACYYFKGTEVSPVRSGLRFDVYALKRTAYSKSEVRIYEIKSSRKDFTSDKKWQKYLLYCTHFYFVAPVGVIDLNDLPEKIGLIEIFYKNGKMEHVFKRKCRRLRSFPDNDLYVDFLEGILCRYIEQR